MKKSLQSGVSLLEVLAAIFVLSVGLLGVLAVVPFGAFQVSKARHAEYASNMLANAAEELVLREMIKPRTWGISNLLSNGSNTRPPEVVFGNVTVNITETKTGTRTKTVTVQPGPDDPPGTPPTVTTTSSPIASNTVSFMIPTVNCTRFLWVEPCKMNDPDHHIYCVGSTFEPNQKWLEWMRGQDDLLYTVYDTKRPDFADQDDKILGSGKYSWFFTFLPEVHTEHDQVIPPTNRTGNYFLDPIGLSDPDYRTRVEINVDFEYEISMTTDPPIPLTPIPPFPPIPSGVLVPLRVQSWSLPPIYVDSEYPSFQIPTWYRGSSFSMTVKSTVDVDILACYNRVPNDDCQVSIPPDAFAASRDGGTFTLPDAKHLELLMQTKYVFVTWETPQGLRGAWCKIVFVNKSNSASPKMIVTGNLPNRYRRNMQVYIPSGVLYHKRVNDVPIRE